MQNEVCAGYCIVTSWNALVPFMLTCYIHLPNGTWTSSCMYRDSCLPNIDQSIFSCQVYLIIISFTRIEPTSWYFFSLFSSTRLYKKCFGRNSCFIRNIQNLIYILPWQSLFAVDELSFSERRGKSFIIPEIPGLLTKLFFYESRPR